MTTQPKPLLTRRQREAAQLAWERENPLYAPGDHLAVMRAQGWVTVDKLPVENYERAVLVWARAWRRKLQSA